MIETETTRLPPGPQIPAIAQAIYIAARPTNFFDDCARRYGDCFVLRLPGVAPPIVNFSHPGAIKQIFTADGETLCPGEANLPLGPLLGPRSLLLLDARPHIEEPRLMTPPFHGDRVQAIRPSCAGRSTAASTPGRWGAPFRFTARCRTSRWR